MSAGPNDPSPRPPQGSFSQDFQHSQVSARVPEKIGRGAFATGMLILQGPNEFVLDFVQGMVQPRQVVARVVLPPGVVASLTNALRDNLALYQERFGAPPALRPATPGTPPPSFEEIYSQFKIADEMLSGSYANAALITHSQAEFCIDFITNFYPRSAVSARVYLSAAHATVILNTLTHSFQQYQQKLAAPPANPPQQPPPPAAS
jgi:hypothetical protein